MLNNKLLVSYGQNPQKMIREILDRLEWNKTIPQGATIGLKPNLVVAKPAEQGATTSPELVEGILQYLADHGRRDVVIAEGSWIGDRTTRAFQVCGYTKLAEKFGVSLVDLQGDAWEEKLVAGLGLKVCKTMAQLDYLVNLPVLKGHCQTHITCALKNLKGCIPNREKRRFHSLGLHKPIAYLNKAIRTDLVIVDGLIGDLDFEEGGNPVQMDRIIVGTDPVLIDSYVAELLGYQSEDVPYITIAAEMGVGQTKNDATKIKVINEEHTVLRISPTRAVEDLAHYIVENQACSACYGSLVHALARLNERGDLANFRKQLAIGQGFKGQRGSQLGIGICTKDFSKSLGGCPPTARAILDFLEMHLH